MTGNKSTAQPANNITQQDNNITESDQDIVLLIHLIEIDAVSMLSENKLYIRETLAFKNTGTMRFSGLLRTWVPGGADIINQAGLGEIAKTEMSTGEISGYLPVTRNGDIISWKDDIGTNTIAPLYVVEYTLPSKPEGMLNKARNYQKVFLYPALTKQPSMVQVKLTRSQGTNIVITDETGNSVLDSGSLREENNDVIYTWDMPRFKEINLSISEPAIAPSTIAIYALIGGLIILVLAYPVIRKKSERLRSIEEKLKNSLEKKPTAASPEEANEQEIPETTEDEKQVADDVDSTGILTEEQERQNNDLRIKLNELEKDYASGNMLDEEYEELRGSYLAQIEKINKMKERPG
ncbi:MAG: hypothetical protein FIB08_02915 [Candidatus Methanoperedens sp.]|nr:hypothetical protein [Candidatus Methanoperedens sp.]